MKSDIKAIADMMNAEAIERKRMIAEAKKEIEDVKEAESEELEEADMVPVTPQYVKAALDGLAPLLKTNPAAYNNAKKYLEAALARARTGGAQLVPVQQFVARRLAMANAAKTAAPVDDRSMEQRRADAINSVANSWKDFSDKQAADKAAMLNQHPIKSIWIQNIRSEGARTLVKAQFTMEDGSVNTEEKEESVDPTAYYYKEVARAIRSKALCDVIIAMWHIAYRDPEIIWYYGKSKQTDNVWNPAKVVKTAAKAKHSWMDQVNPKAYEIWRSDFGSGRIYKTEAEIEEDDMLKGRKHNGHLN